MSQSQEEFEVLSSQPNDEQKEIDDENNNNINDNNPSNTNLIASDVQFVNSQSVSSLESSSLESSQQNDNAPDIIHDDNGAINNIQQAMDSLIIEDAPINANNNQSQSIHTNPNQVVNDSSHQNRMDIDDEKDQSEDLNIDPNIGDNNNIDQDEISDSDMNCEDSPAVNLNASNIIINHQNDKKEKEDIDEGGEGSINFEGNNDGNQIKPVWCC